MGSRLRKPSLFLITLSWANLFLLPEWMNLLAPPDQWSRYEFPVRHVGSVTAVVGTCLSLAAVFWALLYASRRNVLAQSLIRLLAVVLLFFPLNRLRDSLNLTEWVPFLSWGVLRHYLPLPVLGLLIVTGFTVLVVLACRKKNQFITSVDLLLSLFIPFLIVTSSRCIGGYLNGDLNYSNTKAAFHRQQEAPAHRVVWIILKTALMHLHNSNEDAYWQNADTIFHRMQALRANTAIVGWFHGYCRLFGHIVQSCNRHSRIRHTYAPAAADNFGSILYRLFPLRWGQEVHIEAHRHITEKALSAVADPRYQFVYVHLKP